MTRRLTLSTKAFQPDAAGGAPAGAPNPAMRPTNGTDMDPGRQWAGDMYDEGVVSDPEQAFGRFTLGEDTEAWLDKNEDGTLIGWVRDGVNVYRYSDVEAWATDVDASDPQRADVPDASAVPGEPGEPGVPGEPGAAAAAPEGDDPLPEDPDAQPSEAFGDEADPATDEADPTAPLEDPTDLPEEEEFDNPFAELEPDAEDPDADTDTDAPDDEQDPADEEEDAEADPDDDGDAEGDDDGDGDGEDDDPDDDEEKRRLFGGKVQMKHMPGKHNQQSHGDWADNLPDHHFPGGHRRSGSSSDSGSGRSSKGPKGGSGAASAPSAPKKAKLTPETVKSLSDEDLDAITLSDDLYDMDTMLAAASELDRRDDVDARTRGFAKHTEPGSPERQALFDAIVPDHWLTWAAQGAKGSKPSKNKRREIEDAYQDFVLAQYRRALDVTNGYFFDKKHRNDTKRKYDEMDFFNGRISRSEFKKYASEELARFFGAGGEQRMTFTEYAAEFYPSYAKAKAKVGSRYLTEHG